MPKTEPRWIGIDHLIAFNEGEVGQTGEPHQILNFGALEGAVMHPRNRFHYSNDEADWQVDALACDLLFAITSAHAFLQGNKRTAFVAAVVFLEANGYTLDCPDRTEFADAILSVIAHQSTQADFEEMFRAAVRRV